MLKSVGLKRNGGSRKQRRVCATRRLLCAAGVCLLAAALIGGSRARAQTATQSAGTAATALPEAPLPALVFENGEPAAAQDTRAAIALSTGVVTGVVTDSDGELVQGAQVALTSGGLLCTAVTDANGRFSFSSVSAGAFHLVVTASGRAADDLDGTLAPGQTFDAGILALHASADVTIEVLGPHAAAEVEVKKEEHQRILGFAPNFYVSYNFRAPALDARQKWELNWRTLTDPVNVALLAGQAGIEQATGAFSGFGPGPDGYGKRFGAVTADFVIGNSLSGWILPIVFKQDPRYFYLGTGTRRHRFFYALSTAVIARGDNGKWQPAYASVLGDFGAGAASNLYYPAVNRQGASLTFENGLLAVGIDGINNVVQEFLLRHVTPGTYKP